jgi:hypothetical protein
MPLPIIAILTLLIFASISFLLPPTLTIQPGHLLIQIKIASAYHLMGMVMIFLDFYKLWKTQAFPFVAFVYKMDAGECSWVGRKTALFTGVIKMTAVPLWLIENVRLPDREGLWQIAIDRGCLVISPRWAMPQRKL